MRKLINIKTIYSKGIYYINSGHERSVKVKRNILALLIRRGISVVISYLMVPLLIGYLNPTRYGIWLTVSVFITWFYLLDIGLGNGLRNRFAEAIATGNDKLAKTLVSTTYSLISIIAILVLVVFFIINPLINWPKLFNVPVEYAADLNGLMIIMASYFSLQFIVKLIGTVLTADQQPAQSGYLNTISSIFSLIFLFISIRLFNASLIIVGIIFAISNFIVPLIASFYFYNKKNIECINQVLGRLILVIRKIC